MKIIVNDQMIFVNTKFFKAYKFNENMFKKNFFLVQ